MLPWDIVLCDMVDEFWANAGTANATAIRAVAAKVGTRLNMMTPSLDVHAAGRFLDLRTNCASGEAASCRIAGRQPNPFHWPHGPTGLFVQLPFTKASPELDRIDSQAFAHCERRRESSAATIK
jgi:hypothetical protein